MGKKLLSIFLVVCMVMPMLFVVNVAATTYGDYTYEVRNGQVTITDFDTSVVGAITIPSEIDGYPVTTIGDSAFRYCDLTSVTIPDSVTTISSFAFANCKSLESVEIPNSVTTIGGAAFNGCISLKSVEIPNSVTTIKYNTFYNCDSLINVIIPDSVSTIENGVFYDCDSLVSIVIPESVITMDEDEFIECDSLKNIDVDINNTSYSSVGGVWFNKDKTKLIRYPMGRTETTYTIPASVTTIGAAFMYCKNLVNIEIPDSVTTIMGGAFRGCRKLSRIAIPDSVTSITSGSFLECEALTSITVGANNKNYSSSEGVLFNKDKTTLIRYPSDKPETIYNIPDSVTKIDDFSFYYSDNLKNVIIPDSVTAIGYGAFYFCLGLTSVEMPESLTTIVSNIFYYCYNLESVLIPKTIISIGNSAFSKCFSLTDVYYGGTEAEWNNIDVEYANDYLTNATIHYEVEAIPSLKFEYTTSGTTATITGLDSSVTGNVVIPSKIKGYTVTAIGEGAFKNRTDITDVTIPDTVTTIGSEAFASCKSITSITIPKSVTNIHQYSFHACTGLKSITVDSGNDYYSSSDGVLFNKAKTTLVRYAIGKTNTSYTVPGTVTAIGGSAFEDCAILTSVTIPNSVTSIGDRAFYDCAKLKGVELPTSVESIGAHTFRGCKALVSFAIPNKVTAIKNDTFRGCSAMTSVTIPASITSIANYAFQDCPELATVYYGGTTQTQWSSISIGSGNSYLTSAALVFGILSTYGNYTYSEIGGKITITDVNTTISGAVVIPDTINGYPVTAIGAEAFSQCSKMTSVTIPKSVVDIEDFAFYYCKTLANIYVKDGNPCFTAVGGVLFNKDKSKIIQYPIGKSSTSYKIPETVTTIGVAAFEYGTKLVSVTIPDSVTSIGQRAFSRCSNLKNLTIPDSVTSIGSYAFRACNAFTEIILPAYLTTISDNMLRECAALKKVTIPASVTSVGNYAFQKCTALKEVVFNGSQENWEKITIGSSGNSYLTNATIHCTFTETEVNETGTTYDFAIRCDRALENEMLTVVSYDNEGRVVSYDLVECDGSAFYTASVPKNTKIKYAKVFVWSDNEALEPLCIAEKVSVN